MPREKPPLDIGQLRRIVALDDLTDKNLREIAGRCRHIIEQREIERKLRAKEQSAGRAALSTGGADGE